ncbi:hypothetical protein EXS62_03285 [Candidatus Kaiserbacteria bacterium]|nr:hypothetical protein [Candidatus Kaiserbacteria bacterium]
MREFFAGVVPIGHSDQRRTIYDLIAAGDAGGGRGLYNLAYFAPMRAGCSIGNHYHPGDMWETYLIFSGEGVMHFKDMDTGEKTQIRVEREYPFKITVPPRMGHTLVATTEMSLLIGATDAPTADNMLKADVL